MKVRFFKCLVDDLTLENTLAFIQRQISAKKPLSHISLNVDSVVRANKEPTYQKTVNQAGLVTLDGMPLVVLSRLLRKPIGDRITGPDIFFNLLHVASKKKWKIYFLGGKQAVLEDVIARIRKEYPGIVISGYKNGYWTQEEEEDVIKKVAISESDILFAALGSPLQDYFIVNNFKKLNVTFATGIGGVFNIVAGKTKRAPIWLQKACLEWFYRFLQEPRRLFKRYFIYDQMIILLALKEIWHSLFGFQHPRSALVRKNISWSLVFQAVGVLISFLMLPITLSYLPAEKYGTLLTLNALVGWFTLFDLGLGLGLQNNLTQALSKKNFTLAQSYVSTAYASLTAIFGFLLILFYTFKDYINWSLVLGTPPSLSGEIASLANVVVFAFSAQFVLRLINNVATANQKNALGRLANMIAGLVSLVSIVIISQTTKDSLLLYGSIISIIPVVVYAVMSIVLFSSMYKKIAPKITAIHWPLLVKMLRLGIKFFTVQLSLVLIHYGDYLIISHIFGSQAVVSYNVAYKYFALLTTSFALVLAPFWPATTDAYARKEIDWIKNAARNLKKMFWVFFIAGSIMLAISPWFFNFWLKGAAVVPLSISLAMFIYSQLLNRGNVYTIFINGIGRIKPHMWASLAGAIINIPLSILLAKYTPLGMSGVILASAVSIFYGYTIAPWLYRKLIRENQ